MESFKIRFAINLHVAPFLSGPALLALCHTHGDFRESSMSSFIKKMRVMMQVGSSNERLVFAAEVGSRELCELAYLWRNNFPWEWNWMLYGAARGVDFACARELCPLARSWILSAGEIPDGNRMLRGAAYAGNIELCHLARSWISEFGRQPDLTGMLDYAASRGQCEICILAHQWLLEDVYFLNDYHRRVYNDMLYYAFRGEDGHHTSHIGSIYGPERFMPTSIDIVRKLCILVHEWRLKDGIAIDWSAGFQGASKRRDPKSVVALFELAHTWGGYPIRVFSYLFNAAVSSNQREVCEFLHKWSLEIGEKINWVKMLNIAARCGYRDLCISIREWNTQDANEPLNLDDMLATAISGGHADTIELAHEWISQAKCKI